VTSVGPKSGSRRKRSTQTDSKEIEAADETAGAESAPLYRADLCYMGEGFHGWQSQKSKAGIQDAVEQALTTFLRHPVRVRAAARTDTGVHAQHQVAVFRTNAPFDARRWPLGINGLLPPRVRVTSVAEAAPDFHPILSSTGKAYRYRIWNASFVNPFFAPLLWQVHRDIDVKLMRRAARDFVGRHDFSSFCASDSSAKTRTREVWEIEIIDRRPLIEIWVSGEGFLKQMVRNMVGTLVAIGLGRLPVDSIPRLLSARDRRVAGKTAPGQGLTLVRIFYDKPPKLSRILADEAAGFTQGVTIPTD